MKDISGESNLPKHIAIIMDGNGRWASKRRLPRVMGHRAGQEALEALLRNARKVGVPMITVFAFSSENWGRPADEVENLLDLFMKALVKKVPELVDAGVMLKFIGELEAFPEELRKRMAQAETDTADCSELRLNVAVAYGGRWDITAAARKLAEQAKAGELDPRDIDEDRLAAKLSLADLPDPDMLIRTGYERRISNFLLWQLAYAELYFADCLWPDFGEREFTDALAWFAERERRFGKLLPDSKSAKGL